jgi:hypothetical protein
MSVSRVDRSPFVAGLAFRARNTTCGPSNVTAAVTYGDVLFAGGRVRHEAKVIAGTARRLLHRGVKFIGFPLRLGDLIAFSPNGATVVFYGGNPALACPFSESMSACD